MKIKTEKIMNPPRFIIYGVPGVGKSTFAASLPNPIFIDIEGKADHLGVPRFDQAKKLHDVEQQLEYLIKTEHEYKTIVIDSIDWLERLAYEEVALVKSVSEVSAVPFGQGYNLGLKYIDIIIDKLDILRDQKRMIVCLIGHAKIQRFEDPASSSYDRYHLDLREKVAASLVEWAEMVLFANYKYVVKKEGESFGEKVMKGVGTGQRVIYTEERPAYIAKNCYGLPPEMPLSWPEIVSILKTKKENNDTK
jgi:hypothetical protein